MSNINYQEVLNQTFCLEPSWLIPVTNNHPNSTKFLKDTAIVIENQVIIDILPIKESRTKYPNISRKVLNQHVVMPGFVNAHTHSPMNILKGYADDLPLMTWLNDYIWPVENKCFSNEFAYDGAILAIAEMLKSGTTSINDMYFYSDSIAQAAIDLGMRASIGTHVFDFPSPWADNIDEYINHCQRVVAEFGNHDLITPVICPHAPYTVCDDSFKKVIKFAEKYQVPIGCHIHETLDEIEQSLENHQQRPLARLAKLGVLKHNFHAIHSVQLNADDIDLLANHNIPIVHCPESNLKLASGFCPIKEVLQQNITIAIGTDGAASNNDLDMLSEMRTAALVAKTCGNDPTVLPDYQAVECATLNGAKVIGIDNKIGSLTIGKEADIISVNLDDLGSKPIYNPVSSLVYTATRHQVSNVWVKGTQKVADGILLAISNKKIESIISKWQDKIQEIKQHAGR